MPAPPDAAPEASAGATPSGGSDTPATPEGRADAAALGAVRAELDRLDDAIHDLLMRRAEVVARMAAMRIKSNGAAIRPGREAMILRRLVARHRGALPRTAILRLWRELFAATTAMQAPFSVAVFNPQMAAGYVLLAREQYGLATPMRVVHSAPQVLAAVSAGEAQLGVLPVPREDDTEAWWPALMNQERPSLRVVARLPFGPRAEDGSPDVQAYVVAALDPDATDDDRSLLACEIEGEASRARLTAALQAAGLVPHGFVQRRAAADERERLLLIEVAGFVASRDPRLGQFQAALAPTAAVGRLVPIGAYAVPLAETGAAPSPAAGPGPAA